MNESEGSHSLPPVFRSATIFTTLAALAFWIFFQSSKLNVLSNGSPFANDPPDAVGSIAVQVALAASGLTLARAHAAQHSLVKAHLARNGWWTILGAIFFTMATDLLATLLNPPVITAKITILYTGLFLSVGLAACAGFYAYKATRSLANLPAGADDARDYSLASAIVDGWRLIASIITSIARIWNRLAVISRRIERFGDRLLGWLMRSWASPAHHPWRFYCALGTGIGLFLFVAKGFEEGGLPRDWNTILLLVAIFVIVELGTALLGGLLLGRWLGIAPLLVEETDYLLTASFGGGR